LLVDGEAMTIPALAPLDLEPEGPMLAAEMFSPQLELDMCAIHRECQPARWATREKRRLQPQTSEPALG
jgi:hypothetical protein